MTSQSLKTHRGVRGLVASGLCLLAADFVQAQQTIGPIVGQVVPNITVERSYTFDIAIVVVVFGAALFAVCRSSQRR
jgi:hypothetical protein